MNLPTFHPNMLTDDERLRYRQINGRRLAITDKLRRLSPKYGDVFLRKRANKVVNPKALEMAEALKSLSAEKRALQQEVSELKQAAQKRHVVKHRLSQWKGVQPINATIDWTNP